MTVKELYKASSEVGKIKHPDPRIMSAIESVGQSTFEAVCEAPGTTPLFTAEDLQLIKYDLMTIAKATNATSVFHLIYLFDKEIERTFLLNETLYVNAA